MSEATMLSELVKRRRGRTLWAEEELRDVSNKLYYLSYAEEVFETGNSPKAAAGLGPLILEIPDQVEKIGQRLAESSKDEE